MQDQYQRMDIRYGCTKARGVPCGQFGVQDREEVPMVWLLTWVEALVDTPLCFIVFIAYVQGWKSRRPIELVLCTSHFLGTVFFMGTEFYDGLRNVPPQPNNVGSEDGMFANLVGPSDPRFEAQFSFFWFAFVACNFVWYYVPARLGYLAASDMQAALEGKKLD